MDATPSGAIDLPEAGPGTVPRRVGHWTRGAWGQASAPSTLPGRAGRREPGTAAAQRGTGPSPTCSWSGPACPRGLGTSTCLRPRAAQGRAPGTSSHRGRDEWEGCARSPRGLTCSRGPGWVSHPLRKGVGTEAGVPSTGRSRLEGRGGGGGDCNGGKGEGPKPQLGRSSTEIGRLTV